MDADIKKSLFGEDEKPAFSCSARASFERYPRWDSSNKRGIWWERTQKRQRILWSSCSTDRRLLEDDNKRVIVDDRAMKRWSELLERPVFKHSR